MKKVHLLQHQLRQTATVATNKNSVSVNVYSNTIILFVDTCRSIRFFSFFFPYFLTPHCVKYFLFIQYIAERVGKVNSFASED